MQRKKSKSVNYKTYRKQFENMVKKGVLAKGVKYNEYVEEPVNFEDYRQCYNPEFTPRKEMPKYWFVSKEGFLINVKGGNISFVRPNLGQSRPQFTISNQPKNKHISTYGLVGLVWDSYIEADAYTLMSMGGIDCIGSNPKADENGKIKGRVQPHHIAPEGYIKEQTLENYILNNRPEYIQFLTNKDHTTISELTGNIKDDMEKFVDVEYKYDDVPQEHIKVFAYKEIDLKTGNETKIERVLTTEEMQRMKVIPISAHVVNEKKSQKVRLFSVRAKEDKDIELYNNLPEDEKVGLRDYIQSIFKSNKNLIEVEVRYKELSMIATRKL